jgi:AraC-like DNA-binding protein
MDGITFCQKVKQNTITSHIPIVMLTAMGAYDKITSGYESGADSYLVKPFNPDLLMARVKNLLDTRALLRAKYLEDLRFKPKEIKVSSLDEEFLDHLSKNIEANFADSNYDVSKMCEELRMGHVQFIRKVKQLTGKKPVDLLKNYRLTQAKQLLSQQHIPVSEVGYMVGYDVPNSFTRAFKAEFGMAPSAFVDNGK